MRIKTLVAFLWSVRGASTQSMKQSSSITPDPGSPASPASLYSQVLCCVFAVLYRESDDTAN